MEGDRELGETLQAVLDISIHSLRMEGDYGDFVSRTQCSIFQSTPSAWRETSRTSSFENPELCISIHSLRMEGDLARCSLSSSCPYFNPLPPHGGRPGISGQQIILFRNFNPLPPHGGRLHRKSSCTSLSNPFQSTPSAWRETGGMQGSGQTQDISIHSLRMEGDQCRLYRERNPFLISIHSLRMEGDLTGVRQA